MLKKSISIILLVLILAVFLQAEEKAINPFLPQKENPKDEVTSNKSKAPIKTDFISVNYAVASEIAVHIENIINKNPDASLSIDSRSNTIIITDTEESILMAKEIIKRLDTVTPQVLIEAKIVEVNTNFSRDIGINWDVKDTETSSNDETNFDFAMNMPTASNSFLGFNLNRSSAKSKLLIEAKLLAMESEGKGKIISSPRILTRDNKEALIKQGLEYPYLKEIDENGVARYALKSLFLTLKVIPHITPDKRIALNIHIVKDDLGNLIGGKQSFLSKEAKTELLVNDEDIVVIGGILKNTNRIEENRFPILSKIPILGFFFRSKKTSTEEEELIIFISPKIIELPNRN